MAKGTTFSNQLLQLIFNGTAISSPSLAMNESSTPLTSLYVSLHVADPTAGGNQSSSEATAYTGYARVAVARTTGGWTVTSNSVSPAANVVFPLSTGGSAISATNWAIGTASSGAGEILWTGTISPAIAISNGVTPILTSASTVVET